MATYSPAVVWPLLQGLPLGSGLGSSAASAAAAAAAVNGLFGGILSDEQLVLAGLQSEAVVSGYHADNIAPAIMGGFALVRCSKQHIARRAPIIATGLRFKAAVSGCALTGPPNQLLHLGRL